MQFWPRKRAKSEVARIRTWAKIKEPQLTGFSGYKVGMKHVMLQDTRDHAMMKGETVSWPVTIIECPPLTAFSIKFYKNNNSVAQIFADKFDKQLQKKMKIPKETKKVDDIKTEEFDDIKLIVHTNPGLTTIGKKKP